MAADDLDYRHGVGHGLNSLHFQESPGSRQSVPVTMTMKSMKYSDCDTIMDGYNPVPPPLPRRVPPVRNIYAEPFATDTSTSSRYR